MKVSEATRKRQAMRANVSRFASLLATPATGAFTLPASGRFSFSRTAGSTQGQTVVTITGPQNRTLRSPGSLPNQKFAIDSISKSSSIQLSSGFNMYLDTGLGKFKKIAGAA